MRIIGVTGTLGAGKGTIVAYLVKEHGFAHYSARDFIAEEVRRRGLPVNRDTLTSVANSIREEHGPGYITESLYARARAAGKDAVIESIRTPGEVAVLKSKPHFYLLSIDADPQIRYERIRKRGTETDHVSFEKFLADEEREMRNSDPTKQNVAAVMEQTDYALNNVGSVEELAKALEIILRDMSEKTAT